MIVDFDKSLGRIKDTSVLKRIESSIIKLEKSDKIEDVLNTKKLK